MKFNQKCLDYFYKGVQNKGETSLQNADKVLEILKFNSLLNKHREKLRNCNIDNGNHQII